MINPKIYRNLKNPLDNMDEYVTFKKYFVTMFDGKTDDILQFLSPEMSNNSVLEKYANFIFRCRRIRYIKDQKQSEQIRMIFKFNDK